MLLQFSVENFRSFRDKATFSLLVPEGSSAKEHTYFEESGYRVLRAAALYGANASGKSNFSRAIATSAQLIQTRTQADEPLPVVPFRLDAKQTTAPTTFEFELLLDGTRHSYGFSLDRKRIHSEWLFRTRGDEDEELVFERGAKTDDWKFGPLLEAVGDRVHFVAEGTRPNQLFLTEAIDRNLATLRPVYDWFSESLTIIAPEARYFGLERRVRDDAAFRQEIVKGMAAVDTGIVGVSTQSKPVDLKIRSEQPSFLEAVREGAFDTFDGALVEKEGAYQLLRLVTKRRDAQDKDVEFSLGDESDGTVRFMHLVPALSESVLTGSLLVVDELDRSLHTLLTLRFVREFLAQPAENRRQLIYTTHDTNLLTRDLLPPEAVWFTEKDMRGATSLYSLAEFDQEQLTALGPSLEAGYLAGRFGAIPFLADRTRLGWVGSETDE